MKLSIILNSESVIQSQAQEMSGFGNNILLFIKGGLIWLNMFVMKPSDSISHSLIKINQKKNTFCILITATMAQPTLPSTTAADSTQGKQKRFFCFEHFMVNVIRVNCVETTTDPKITKFSVVNHWYYFETVKIAVSLVECIEAHILREYDKRWVGICYPFGV